MPDNINGIFFENQILTAKGLGAFGNSALSDGILTGCKVSINGLSVTVDEGYIIICGRVVKISQQSLTLIASSSRAYSAIIATVDTSLTSDETDFNQVSLSVSSGDASVTSPIVNVHSGYDSTNQFTYDINMSGTSASTWLVLFSIQGNNASPFAYNYAIANSLDPLWTNSSPNSSFEHQTTVLRLPALTAYNAILVVYKAYNESVTDDNVRSSMICPFVRGSGSRFYYGLSQAVLTGSSPNYTVVVRQRNMYITPSSGLIEFSYGWRNGSAASDAIIIPLEIYGMRAGISY